jgi:hypothetical protein
MFKQTSLVLCGLVLGCISFTAIAAKPTEALIYHCGCEYSEEAGSELLWGSLIVNSKSRGHRSHEAGDVETCTYVDQNFIEQETELVRGFDDCEEGDLLTGVATCDTEGATQTPIVGESCAPVESVCPCAENPEWDAFLEAGSWSQCKTGPLGSWSDLLKLDNGSSWAFSGSWADFNGVDFRCGTVTNFGGNFVGFFGITAEEEAACAAEMLVAADVVGTTCTDW